MTIYWPDYCQDFKCKAGDCVHTCCAGWVIGIDKDSLARFKADPDVACKIKPVSVLYVRKPAGSS